MYKIYYLTSIIDCYQPRYVGYSRDVDDRLKNHINESRYKKSKTHKVNWINNLLKKDLLPILIILDETNSLDEVLRYERTYIKNFKEWFNLTNSTDGGEKSKSIINDIKDKISKSLKEYYSKNDVWNKGLTYSYSDERNRKRKEKMGDVISGENNHFYGKEHSIDTRKKLSLLNRIYDYNYKKVFDLYIRKNLNGKETGEILGIPANRMNKIIRKYNLLPIKLEIYGKRKGKKEILDVNFEIYYKPGEYF